MYLLFEKYQKWWEITFWILIITINGLVIATSVLMEYARDGRSIEIWEPFIWELSSGLGVLLLIPLIIRLDNKFPFNGNKIAKTCVLHLLFSITFSMLHVSFMFGLRKLLYWALGGSYEVGDWLIEFVYEYRKDLISYMYILGVIYSYRFIISRLKGEAKFVAEGEAEPESSHNESLTKRLLVKKLGKEFIINLKDVDWIESAGNYVNLHVADRVYPLRQTMNNMQERLSQDDFIRIHRSYMVKIDKIKEMEPLETGDIDIVLDTGKRLRLSRRYKNELKTLLG